MFPASIYILDMRLKASRHPIIAIIVLRLLPMTKISGGGQINMEMGYWPLGAKREVTREAFIQAYGTLGYSVL